MAINKKLIHFKNKTKFDEELAKNNINDASICFIQDTQQIWTHGQLYNCSVNQGMINESLKNYYKKSEVDSKVSEYVPLNTSTDYTAGEEFKTISIYNQHAHTAGWYSDLWDTGSIDITPGEINLYVGRQFTDDESETDDSVSNALTLSAMRGLRLNNNEVLTVDDNNNLVKSELKIGSVEISNSDQQPHYTFNGSVLLLNESTEEFNIVAEWDGEDPEWQSHPYSSDDIEICKFIVTSINWDTDNPDREGWRDHIEDMLLTDHGKLFIAVECLNDTTIPVTDSNSWIDDASYNAGSDCVNGTITVTVPYSLKKLSKLTVNGDEVALTTNVYSKTQSDNKYQPKGNYATVDQIPEEKDLVVNTTYADLRMLYEKQELVPGQFYRITDYVASANMPGIVCENHPFDIIVQALDHRTLSEQAKAVKHDGDTYFNASDLALWELKYSLINDSSKYPWAVSENSNKMWLDDSIIIKKSALDTFIPDTTITIDNSLWYAYSLAHLNPSDLRVFKYLDSNTSVGVDDFVLVTVEPYEEQQTTLYAVHKTTGMILGQWNRTIEWSYDNAGFGGEEGGDCLFDMRYLGDSIIINGTEYYLWEPWDGDFSRFLNYIGSPRQMYEGNIKNLYLLVDTIVTTALDNHPIQFYDPVNQELYTGVDIYDSMDEYWYTVSSVISTYIGQDISSLQHGVIYYLKDHNGNEASFDFKNIRSSYGYFLGTTSVDYSQSSAKNNKLVCDKIPNVTLQHPDTKGNYINIESSNTATRLYSNGFQINNRITVKSMPTDITLNVQLNNCVLTTSGGSINHNSPYYSIYNSEINLKSFNLDISGSYEIYNLEATLTQNVKLASQAGMFTNQNSAKYILVNNQNVVGVQNKNSEYLVSSFTDNAITLLPKVYHIQTNPTDTLTIKLFDASDNGTKYYCEFTTKSTGTTVLLPGALLWEDGILPSFENDTTYILHILGNKAKVQPFYYNPDDLQLLYTASQSNSNVKNHIENLLPSDLKVLNHTLDSNRVGLVTTNKPIRTINSGGYYARQYLSSITFPNSVYNTEKFRANDYQSLQSLTIGNGIRNAYNFQGYNNSLKVYAPSLEAWLQIDFQSQSLNSGQQLYINGSVLPSAITIPSSLSKIGSYVLANYVGLELVNIPNTVKTIGNRAFMGFAGTLYLDSQEVESKLTTGFYNNKITHISYGMNISELHCSGLNYVNEITLPYSFNAAKVSFIPTTWPSSVATIKCSGIGGWLKLDFPNGYSGLNTIHLCDSTGTPYTTLSISQTIRPRAFKANKDLTALTLSGIIGARAFQQCSNLVSLDINSSQEIGEYAFNSCTSLAHVVLKNCTTIAKGLFSKCSALTSITIPTTVTRIEDYAFSMCSNLQSVYCWNLVPPELGSTNVFYENAPNRKIYVPIQSVDAYKAAPGWNLYADSIIGQEIPRSMFELDGISYEFEEGMTWEDWLNSDYNTDGFWEYYDDMQERYFVETNNGYICTESGDPEFDTYYYAVETHEQIQPIAYTSSYSADNL